MQYILAYILAEMAKDSEIASATTSFPHSSVSLLVVQACALPVSVVPLPLYCVPLLIFYAFYFKHGAWQIEHT